MTMESKRFKVAKVFTICPLEGDDQKTFWALKTPQERLEALETMRQIAYGYDPVTTRLQRIFEIIEPV